MLIGNSGQGFKPVSNGKHSRSQAERILHGRFRFRVTVGSPYMGRCEQVKGHAASLPEQPLPDSSQQSAWLKEMMGRLEISSSNSTKVSDGSMDLSAMTDGLNASVSQLPQETTPSASSQLADTMDDMLSQAPTNLNTPLTGVDPSSSLNQAIAAMNDSVPQSAVGEEASAPAQLADVLDGLGSSASMSLGSDVTYASAVIAHDPVSTSVSASSQLADIMGGLRNGADLNESLSSLASGSNTVEAAERLQQILSTYTGNYGPATDERIAAAVARLQAFINDNAAHDSSSMAAVVVPADGATSTPAFHNYLVDGLSNTLDEVHKILSTRGDAAADVSDAVVIQQRMADRSTALSSAMEKLRNLADQIQDADSLYVAVNVEEQQALSTVVGQLHKIAERIQTVEAERVAEAARAAASVPASVDAMSVTSASTAAATAVLGQAVPEDPILDLLDRLYQGIVIDSGLRHLLISVKQLGDGLAMSMDQAWSVAPHLSRLVAYIVALAGVAYLMRNKVPSVEQIQESMKFPTMGNEEGSGTAGGGLAWPKLDNVLPKVKNTSSSRTVAEAPEKVASIFPSQDGSVVAWGSKLLEKDQILDLIRQIGALDLDGAAAGPTAEATRDSAAGQPKSSPPPPTPSDFWGLGAGSTPILNEKLPSEGSGSISESFIIGAVATVVNAEEEKALGALSIASASNDASRPSTASVPDSSLSTATSTQAINMAPTPPTITPPSLAAAALPTSSEVASVDAKKMGSREQILSYSGNRPTAAAAANATDALLRAFSEEGDDGMPSTVPPALGSANNISMLTASASRAMGSKSKAPPEMVPLGNSASRASRPQAAQPGPAVLQSSSSPSSVTGQQWGKAAVLDENIVLAPPTPRSAEVNSAVATSAAAMAAAMAAAAVAQAMGPEAERMAKMAVEAEKRQHDEARAQLSQDIKERLGVGACALGPVLAVVPGGEYVRDQMDTLIDQLETLSPSEDPSNDVQLLGDWKLVYASNGSHPPQPQEAPTHNIFAQLLQVADAIPGFGMETLTQSLKADARQPGVVLTENSTTFSFGPLGSWRVRVTGKWSEQGSGIWSNFETFAVRPVSFVGLPSENFPEVATPIPSLLKANSVMRTTYLDGDTRVCRDSNGSLYLFKKE